MNNLFNLPTTISIVEALQVAIPQHSNQNHYSYKSSLAAAIDM